jgi:hypothetical protein
MSATFPRQGAPTAVAEPVAPRLIAAYHRWLELEQYLLAEETPEPPSGISRCANAMIADLAVHGHYADYSAMLRAEQRVADIEAEFRAEWCHFRARASLGGKLHQSPVDQFYLTRDMAIVSPPASTRAALVLSAVGIDWKGA